ncbi:MAG: thioredoxin-disulfide reductase [Clostridia bacterium]|nr:thioredoxin-disulfide reductase [Clostridia bacterium]
MTDVLIIGAGPAGLTAAIYARRAGLSVKIYESSMYGGQILTTPEVENYPSIKKISGWELAENLYEQASSLGAELVFEEISGIEDLGTHKRVLTASGEEEAKTVIIANGAKRRKLEVPGEDSHLGMGVSYCATCDGAFFAGKVAAVVGGGSTALEDALYLANLCERVHLIHRREGFRGQQTLLDAVTSHEKIEIHTNRVPLEVVGDGPVQALRLRDTVSGEEETLPTDAVFVAIGLSPDNGKFAPLVKLDESGYILASEDCHTNVPGIYAAGDTRKKSLRQIVTAASDGAIAATEAFAYLQG